MSQSFLVWKCNPLQLLTESVHFSKKSRANGLRISIHSRVSRRPDCNLAGTFSLSSYWGRSGQSGRIYRRLLFLLLMLFCVCESLIFTFFMTCLSQMFICSCMLLLHVIHLYTIESAHSQTVILINQTAMIYFFIFSVLN